MIFRVSMYIFNEVYTMLYFSTDMRHTISQCNFNYSPEGILHPDRIMQEYDFLYMLNGEWEIIENDICYPIKEGELLILEPGLHHYSQKKCSPHMRNMFLHCPPLPSDGKQEAETVAVNKLTDCKKAPKISRLFRAIIEEYWSASDTFKQLRLGSLFSLLLAELAECSEKTDAYDPLVAELQQLFLSNSERFFHLEELAKHFGISAHTLGIRFKNATGTSLYHYQLTQKLNMIHELLPQNPGRGLRDIALSYGFYDEFQFSKLYKRQFGFPPSHHRQGM